MEGALRGHGTDWYEWHYKSHDAREGLTSAAAVDSNATESHCARSGADRVRWSHGGWICKSRHGAKTPHSRQEITAGAAGDRASVSLASTEASSAKGNMCLVSQIKWRLKPTDSAETFRAVVSKTEVKRAALHNRDTATARSQAVWRGHMHKIRHTSTSHGYVYAQR